MGPPIPILLPFQNPLKYGNSMGPAYVKRVPLLGVPREIPKRFIGVMFLLLGFSRAVDFGSSAGFLDRERGRNILYILIPDKNRFLAFWIILFKKNIYVFLFFLYIYIITNCILCCSFCYGILYPFKATKNPPFLFRTAIRPRGSNTQCNPKE